MAGERASKQARYHEHMSFVETAHTHETENMGIWMGGLLERANRNESR